METNLVHVSRRRRVLPCPPDRSDATPKAEPTLSGFDREYCLAHCEGYRVESAAGRLGVVEEVRAHPTRGKKPILAIRAGLLGRRVLLVPTPEVDFIVPRAKRIWLRSPVALLGTEART